jgi:hypothetical protein
MKKSISDVTRVKVSSKVTAKRKKKEKKKGKGKQAVGAVTIGLDLGDKTS